MTDKLKSIAEIIILNEPMSEHTTFKIGGPADYFVSVTKESEISNAILWAKENNIPYMIIGNGSNMLVSDKGIRGLVIEVGKNFADIRCEGEKIYVQAGALLSRVAKTAMNESLTGMEEISGIPGTIGGAIYMNAGAYGGEIKNVIETVTYLDCDGEIKTVTADECEFGYRTSIFETGDKVILSTVLKLKKGNLGEIKEKMADFTNRRKTKQPLAYPSAGSTFKRPEGHFAGALVENSGLKGYTVGKAQISELHAGFVINIGGATCEDVLGVIRHAQKIVKEKYDVCLEPEIRLVGEGM